MANQQTLEGRRLDLLRQLGEIRTLRKGSLNEQWFPSVRQGKKTKELRGPYFLWTHKKNNKTVSERVVGEQALFRARQDEENYRRFRELCREYEVVAQELGELEHELPTADEAVKKGLKPQSNKARKSNG